jgi:hypothetical protein
MQLYADPLHEEFTRRALGFNPAGGADLGEVLALADQRQEPDDDEFFDIWSAAARRHHDTADAAADRGRRATAGAHSLRAACFLTVA